MSSLAKLASIDVRATSRTMASVQPKVERANSYSDGRSVASRLGSSVFTETRTPAVRNLSIGWASIDGQTFIDRLEVGQIPSGMPRSASSATTLLIFDRPHTMIDAVCTQKFYGIAHAFRSARFAGVNGPPQPGGTGPSVGIGKAGTSAAGSCLVSIDRKRRYARVAPFDELIDQFDRFVCCLGAQQADAQAHRRQAILFRRGETRIEGIDHRPGPPVPGTPVGRIDNDIGIAGAIGGEALAESIGHLGQTVRGVCKPASPVEKVQEVAKSLEFQQAFARSRHCDARVRRPLLQCGGLESAFEMNMDLGLGQGAQRGTLL